MKTVEVRHVAAARISDKATLREKAAEVETERTVCARTEEEEAGGEGRDWRMTLRRKKLKAFLERGRVGARGETKSAWTRGNGSSPRQIRTHRPDRTKEQLVKKGADKVTQRTHSKRARKRAGRQLSSPKTLGDRRGKHRPRKDTDEETACNSPTRRAVAKATRKRTFRVRSQREHKERGSKGGPLRRARTRSKSQ